MTDWEVASHEVGCYDKLETRNEGSTPKEKMKTKEIKK